MCFPSHNSCYLLRISHRRFDHLGICCSLLPPKNLPSTAVLKHSTLVFPPARNTDHVPYPYKTVTVMAAHFTRHYVFRWTSGRRRTLNWMFGSVPLPSLRPSVAYTESFRFVRRIHPITSRQKNVAWCGHDSANAAM
jgi:hypothetical protein